MQIENPLAAWRKRHNMTQRQLAEASGAKLWQVKAAEAGRAGLAGQPQDYLEGTGANVSQLAAERSAFIAWARRPDQNDG